MILLLQNNKIELYIWYKLNTSKIIITEMSQKQIDLFFTPISKKPKPEKKQFNWILNDDNVVTTSLTPPSAKPICSYHPFRNKKITISFYDQREKSRSKLFTDFEPINSRMINLLKSNLQKCVRRRKISEGLRSAYQLVRANPKETFRRWLVICVEDAVCCEYFPALTWITIALHYGYDLQMNDLHLFISSVSSILSDDRCDDIDMSTPVSAPEISKFDKYPPIVQSLLVRASLGGMKGDMNMLINSAKLWFESNDFDIMSTKHKCLDKDMMDIGAIEPSDILPESNDFHVSKKNLDIYNRYEYSDEEMRKAIWYHSSGIIYRDSIREGSMRSKKFEDGVKKTEECWKRINE